jgi:BirA family biotin operon repressor/biotin-[acetyl-CoA-carboxylase] ligase
MRIMLELKLSTPFKNAPVFYKPETESTMIDARNLAGQGFPTGTLVVAGYQTTGRGRFPERKWESPPDESLLCTLILRTSDLTQPIEPIPLKAGLAVARMIEEEFGLNPTIKWPNDVFLGERKVAGILAELKEGVCLVGIGINCLQKSFPKELRKSATSLRKVTGKRFEPKELIPSLLQELYRWFFNSAGEDLNTEDSWKTEVEKRLYLRNKTIGFQPGIPGKEEPISGILLGITEEGLLLIQPEESADVVEFAAGEILPPSRSFPRQTP